MIRISRTHVFLIMLLALLTAVALRLPNLPEAPPGLHYDEAANGILSANIGLRGDHPIFIASYTGKEVLFFYLAGGLMRLLGDSIFALRLTAAFVGLLTISATYWLGRELGLKREVVIIAASLLAVSFWHVLFSRLGFRAITQPLLQALTLAALLRGLRRKQWGWLLLAGLFLGLTAYTYLAARLFPILLLLAALPLLLSRATWRRRWTQLMVTAVTGGIILSPLLAYFVQHPDAFWVRIGQVAPGTAGLSLGESTLRSLQMLFLVGDPYIRFNLPGRPLFNVFWGTLLVVGWLGLWLRWREREDWQRMAALLLLLSPLLMLLPTALATNEIVPSNLRAIGLIPLLFYLPGLGLQHLLQSLEGWLQSRMVALTTLATAVTILILGGIFTERLYFREWATDPQLFYENDGDLTAVARFLDEEDLSETTVYVTALHYQHPTLAFLSKHYDAVKWLPGSDALVFPEQAKALYIFSHNSPLPDWARPFFADFPGDITVDAPITTIMRTSPPEITPPYTADVNFGNTITLLGYNARPAYTGETMPVTLYWRVDAAPTINWMPFVHLEDVWKYRWSQVESFAYPAAQWQPGEVIVQRVDLPISPGTPPGPYRLRIGLFDPATGNRLPQLDGNGRFAGDSYILEFVGVLAGPLPETMPQSSHPMQETIAPGLQLLGYERGGMEIATGETLPLALWWQAEQPLPPLATRLELLKPDHTGQILLATQPVHNTYPFNDWYTPQFLIDHVDPMIPANFSAGSYRLQLRILNEDDETLFTTSLGDLNITATERLFIPPPTQMTSGVVFGNELLLLGYDLEETAVHEFTLRLVWQAEELPTEDYTVFVHLLGQDGVCCVWQQDAMPQQNQYPTTRWLPDEVVVDSYTIRLPDDAEPGDYPIEIGLYVAETGLRLPVSGTGVTEGGDAVWLRPLALSQ
ncbi:MAG: glycosyltransferase family 39 protein [Ardenticatenaceae bacterium]|nr:glycosyltransferase family 39 protein [Ardenticatenaceae bacterium]